ncbi:MAG: CPBP family glutamic-type intramembrane protease [Acidimicrobiales bacterium]
MSNPWAYAPAAPPSPPLPPPAWYPDPSGMGQLRYWDGGQWTLGVAINGQVMERPMPWPPTGWGGQGAWAPQAPTKPPDERIQLPGTAIWYAIAGFVAGLVSGVGLGVVADVFNAPDIVVLLLNVAGLWTGLLGACWLASRRWGTGHIAHDYGLKIQSGDVGWGLLMSLGARVAGAIVAVPFVFGPKRLLNDNSDAYGKVAESWAPFLLFAVVAIVGAPIVEELFFRGLLLRALTTKLGVMWAIGVQAVLFGLAHYSPIVGLANVTVITVISAAGVVFGITAWWRRVGTSVVAHAAFNVIAVIAAALLNFTDIATPG